MALCCRSSQKLPRSSLNHSHSEDPLRASGPSDRILTVHQRANRGAHHPAKLRFFFHLLCCSIRPESAAPHCGTLPLDRNVKLLQAGRCRRDQPFWAKLWCCSRNCSGGFGRGARYADTGGICQAHTGTLCALSRHLKSEAKAPSQSLIADRGLRYLFRPARS